MDDHLLAQGSGHDVEGASKRRKHVGVDKLAERSEPVAFSDQRDTAAQDDSPGRQERDSLPQGEGQRPPRPVEDGLCLGVSFDGGQGDIARR